MLKVWEEVRCEKCREMMRDDFEADMAFCSREKAKLWALF